MHLKVTSYDYVVYIVNPTNSMGEKTASGSGFPIPTLQNQVCAGDYYFKVEHASGGYIGNYWISVCLDTLECEYNDIKGAGCFVDSVNSCYDVRLQGTHWNDPSFPGIPGSFFTSYDLDWYQLKLNSHDSIKVAISNAPVNQRFILECYQSSSTNSFCIADANVNGLNVSCGCFGLDSGIYQFYVHEYFYPAPIWDDYTLSDSTYHICFTRCGANQGIKENTLNTLFSVYPNPAHSALFVELKEAIKAGRVSIKTMLGERTYQTNISSSGKISVDVSKLPTGIYSVELETEKALSVRKFVKQ